MTRQLTRWLAAFAIAFAGVTITVAPANAAGGYCTGPGVNVVIDYGQLGGGTAKGCGHITPNQNTAAIAIGSAGFRLEEIQTGGMIGFVCTIDGQPSNRACSGANGDGYWGLFWANPGGSWVYASYGANALTVSNGETVSFAWQAPGSGTRNPGASPAPVLKRVTPTPSVTRSTTPPASKSTTSRTQVGGKAAAPTRTSASAKPSASASPSAKASPTPSASPSPSASSTATYSLLPATAPVSTKPSSGLPWWVPAGVVALLVVAAGGAWWRKRAGS